MLRPSLAITTTFCMLLGVLRGLLKHMPGKWCTWEAGLYATKKYRKLVFHDGIKGIATVSEGILLCWHCFGML